MEDADKKKTAETHTKETGSESLEPPLTASDVGKALQRGRRLQEQYRGKFDPSMMLTPLK